MSVSLATKTKYTKFVRARNKALERIHIATQLKVSSLVHEKIFSVIDIVKSKYPTLVATGIFTPQGKEQRASLEHSIHAQLDSIVPMIVSLMKSMRRSVYVLTVASEAEAIGQATGMKTKYSLTSDRVTKQQNKDLFSGGSIEDRVQIAINKQIRKILDSVELSAIREMPEDKMLKFLKRALPRPQKVSTKQKNIVVRKLKEASKNDVKDDADIPDISSGYVDDQTWDEAVNSYKDEYIPSWRGDDVSYSYKTEAGDKETVYGWEVEKDINQDFVYQVRQGQVDAAKENGITDYQWIAIIDQVTDDCCVWRDGLTTKEIEDKLNGERSDDDCDAIVPPAHFNCRCDLAPMIKEMPDAPESNEKEFEDWLNDE